MDYFAVGGSELFQGAASQQLDVRPDGPEGDPGLHEGRDIERMYALGRRELTQVVEVFGEQCADLGASEVVDSNLHERELACAA